MKWIMLGTQSAMSRDKLLTSSALFLLQECGDVSFSGRHLGQGCCLVLLLRDLKARANWWLRQCAQKQIPGRAETLRLHSDWGHENTTSGRSPPLYESWYQLGHANNQWENCPFFCSLQTDVSLSVFPVMVLNFQKAPLLFSEIRPSINHIYMCIYIMNI